MKSTTVGMLMAVLAASVSVSVARAEPPANYSTFCVACHQTGAAQAPKTGDKAAWAPRVKAKGLDGLVASAKKGKGAMPPMGLCQQCSDAELKEIIQYMSGASAK